MGRDRWQCITEAEADRKEDVGASYAELALKVAVAVEAEEHSIAGLVDSILKYFDRKGKP